MGAGGLTFGKELITATAGNNVLVRYIASPVTPADVAAVNSGKQGPLGSEGVAVVDKSVGNFKEGDRVLPLRAGSYMSAAFCSESDLVAVPPSLDTCRAACFKTLLTAYQLLQDTKQGETLLLNDCGNALGVAIMQMAQRKGLNVIALVDNQVDYDTRDELIELSKHLGANVAMCQNDAKDKSLFNYATGGVRPSLTINLSPRGLDAATIFATNSSQSRFINTQPNATIQAEQQVPGFQLAASGLARASQELSEMASDISVFVEILGIEDISAAVKRTGQALAAPYIPVLTHENPYVMFPTKQETTTKRQVAELRHAMWENKVKPFMLGELTTAFEQDMAWWNSPAGDMVYKPQNVTPAQWENGFVPKELAVGN
eukprot:TRINITY_DN61405_c0_g1_i1.p1 TRINITY_DN61405_c0_g1~~TRINITY_DN61405_c0_g1_i1.p1  ORF type:complete len:393 (+),score=41.03 TRINITY_DN61405_c0_g1_i1:59-1180(+)